MMYAIHKSRKSFFNGDENIDNIQSNSADRSCKLKLTICWFFPKELHELSGKAMHSINRLCRSEFHDYYGKKCVCSRLELGKCSIYVFQE